jgi:tRNA (cmo5U34)-methyltransferase
MNEFDIKAAEWDKNPMHWKRSVAIVDKIKELIPLNQNMIALEYGAGTGIASFLLKDFVKEITLMDNSSEMVKVIEGKIKTSNAKNLKVLRFDLENNNYKEGKFDLIFNQMVLHHIINTENIIKQFSLLLNSGGYLAIADLYEENGSFHGEGFNGHRGFNIENLSEILRKNGFENVSHETCFAIDHKISETETKLYDIFLLTGRRI